MGMKSVDDHVGIFEISDKRPFHHLPVFWVFTLLPLIISLVLSVAAYKQAGPLDWNFSPEGYGNFAEFYAFPLTLLSFMGVFGVTIARMHGSKQRDRAIKESEKKNDFDRRFKHEEEFTSHLSKYSKGLIVRPQVEGIGYDESQELAIEEESPQVSFDSSFGLYRIYFPSNEKSVSAYSVSVNSEHFRRISIAKSFESMLAELRAELANPNFNTEKYFKKDVMLVAKLASRIHSKLGIDIGYAGTLIRISPKICGHFRDPAALLTLLIQIDDAVDYACLFMGGRRMETEEKYHEYYSDVFSELKKMGVERKALFEKLSLRK